MRRLSLAILGLLLLTQLAGCGKSTAPSAGATGQMRLTLTDAPADIDSVILVIREVAVHSASGDSENWIKFVPAASHYDLLTLQNGVFAELGTWTLPAGHFTQIRLLLDPGSYPVIGGQRVPLTIPSGLQTGLKLIGEFDVPAGSLVDV